MALNEKMKNKYRRAIRVLMVVIAALLLVLGLGVPVVNNALAMQIAYEMEDLPLPMETTVVETTSLAGRVTSVGGSMQYIGALLLKSNCSLAELQAHYAAYDIRYRQVYRVVALQEPTVSVYGAATLSFRTAVEPVGYYAVYAVRTGGFALQWWLDMDMRG